jgi:hypothetical protein
MKTEDVFFVKSVEELRNTLNLLTLKIEENAEANNALKVGLVLLTLKIDENTKANIGLKIGLVAACDKISKRLEQTMQPGPENSETNLVQSCND